MTQNNKYMTTIVSNDPWDDLTALLSGIDRVELLMPCSDVAQLKRCRSLEIADIVFADIAGLNLESEENAKMLGEGFGPYLVFISDGVDADKMRAAMQHGARDFLTRPLREEEIRKVIARAGEYAETRHSMAEPPKSEVKSREDFNVFTFFSNRNGVGKSALAGNMALAMASQSGKTVCLVDLVLQFGDLAFMLDAKPRGNIGNLVLSQPDNLGEVIQDYITPVRENLFLLAASPNPEDGEMVHPPFVTELLNTLAARYDYVVVDTNGPFHDVVLAAMDSSTRIYLVASPVLQYLKDIRAALSLMRDSLNHPEDKIRVILNRYDSDMGLSIADIEKTLGKKILHTVPNDFKVVISSVNQGVPAVESNPRSKFARAIIEMTRKEMGGDAAENSNGKRAFFSRLFESGVAAK